jgi:biopolymer transport protein ExbD
VNLRPQRPEPPDINLAPLIDVVFLLLIFFMVTTSFRDEVGIKIQLPQSSGEPAAESRPLTLAIDAEGTFYVNDRQVADRQPATLSKALAAALVAAGGPGHQLPAGQVGEYGQGAGADQAGLREPASQGGTGGQAAGPALGGDRGQVAGGPAAIAPGDLPLVLKADARTPHQAVMTALDVASQLGLTRFSFAASRSQDVP